MPKPPIVSGFKIVKVLSKLGFEHIRTSGKSIMKQAGINLENFWIYYDYFLAPHVVKIFYSLIFLK